MTKKVRGQRVFKPPQMASRKDNWKLLMNPEGKRIELYDITNDPTEEVNLATKQEAVAKELKAELLKWKASLPKDIPASKYTAQFRKGSYLYENGVGA